MTCLPKTPKKHWKSQHSGILSSAGNATNITFNKSAPWKVRAAAPESPGCDGRPADLMPGLVPL
jgi:hypothetical protein